MPKIKNEVIRKYIETQLGAEVQYEFVFSVNGEYEEETNSYSEVHLRKVYCENHDITGQLSDEQRQFILDNFSEFE